MKTDLVTKLWDAVGIGGAVLIGIGCGLIYLPVGLIVFGLMLLAAAILAAKAD